MKNGAPWAAMRSPERRFTRTAPDTIAAAVEVCRRRLLGISDTPWLDARILASHVTGLDASAVVAYGEHRLPARRREQLDALISRRVAGEPIAYLVGFREFCGLRVGVDRRVLVPRPETEELVVAVVEEWRGRQAQILDLGTGSGAIACALADRLPKATVVATDVSDAALQVAADNVVRFAFGDRIELVAGDLFDPLPPDRRFDVIVANLPYVLVDDADLAPDVRMHEPAIALDAGPDGLSVYRRMFKDAPSRLRDGGRIYCECGPATAAGLARIAGDVFPTRAVTIRNDMSGRERMVLVV
jgi:release factor glutamine methyltransferase